jgi:two-component system, NarL family, invasion response regulator UvrY
MLKILIADDHPIVRRGLKQILSDESDIALVGEAQNGREVLEIVYQEHWDAVVLDIGMPGRGGLDTLKELKRLYPKLPVLMLSIQPEDQFGVRALQAGADGYMNKECAPNELINAIRKIIRGGKYVSETLAEELAFMVGSNTLSTESLSPREYQVMLLIVTGKTLSEIAGEMSLSVKTVSTYKTRVLEKMNMKNSKDLILYAIKNGLISIP